MLKFLRSIIQEVNRAENIDQALTIIVTRVKKELSADACSVYLLDHRNPDSDGRETLILSATDGLLPQSVGEVRLKFGEGIVGLVAERAEPINLASAAEHPSYSYFPETGEAKFHGFLGVPIIHHRRVLGVLVLQQQQESHYNEDDETLLITVAAQLTGAIASAEVSGGVSAQADRRRVERKPLHGIAGAPGIAMGRAVLVVAQLTFDVVAERTIPDEEVEVEQQRLRVAIEAVKQDLLQMESNLDGQLLLNDSALFEAYRMILDGDSFRSRILEEIATGVAAPGALRRVVTSHVEAFSSMEDLYLRSRAEDILDLGLRLLTKLQPNEAPKQKYPKNTILVADIVTAAMLAEVPIRRLQGIVSRRGSGTSHTAILAKALGIPAVLGVDELPLSRVNALEMIVDGNQGEVILRPTKQIKKEYRQLLNQQQQQDSALEAIYQYPAITADGIKVQLLANTGLMAELLEKERSQTDGVGLYRTEYPFMVRDRFPGEKEQVRVYRKVLQEFHPLPVTMRTLDIGGDKALPYFPMVEDNPFLGWRGIRFTLDHPEIFLAQLRAMLQANAGLGNLRILFPMICTLKELDDSLVLLHQAQEELQQEQGITEHPEVGVMIEVPSAVYLLPQIAERADFISIGSNDLTQYLLAVDRNNAQVSELYDSLHPSVIHVLKYITDQARISGIEVSVCGEMAGDPVAAFLLLGLGITRLSMNVSSLARVKWMIRNSSQKRSREVIPELLRLDSADAIRKRLLEISPH
ncbi:MAG: phosphoenolpyruvate--protein phosphotransferase [Gammaproteobacteria bacterium]|nr:phosphoenolpyruvate--protein phosphotransferase [Gammaproteobacteria bacterium]